MYHTRVIAAWEHLTGRYSDVDPIIKKRDKENIHKLTNKLYELFSESNYSSRTMRPRDFAGYWPQLGQIEESVEALIGGYSGIFCKTRQTFCRQSEGLGLERR